MNVASITESCFYTDNFILSSNILISSLLAFLSFVFFFSRLSFLLRILTFLKVSRKIEQILNLPFWKVIWIKKCNIQSLFTVNYYTYRGVIQAEFDTCNHFWARKNWRPKSEQKPKNNFCCISRETNLKLVEKVIKKY